MLCMTEAKILETDSFGFLTAENPLEKTHKVKQTDILKQADVITKRKRFELTLEKFGPFRGVYSHSGKHLLITGRKGQCALLDWKKFKQISEVQINETILDSTFLYNHNIFSTAQKDHV